jgi:predicted ester cyclase
MSRQALEAGLPAFVQAARENMRVASEQNKEVVGQLIDAAFNRKDIAAVRPLLAPGYVEHRFMPGQPDSDFWGYAVATLRTAFPDYHFEIHRLVAEGDWVTVYGSGSGTHRGMLLDIPPTYKAVTWPEVHIVRLMGGKLVEHWVVADNMELMQQLGIIPVPGTPLANAMNAMVGAGIRLSTTLKRLTGKL